MVLFFCLTTLQNWQNCPAALTNHSGFLSIQLGFFRTSRGGANTIRSKKLAERVAEKREKKTSILPSDEKRIRKQLQEDLQLDDFYFKLFSKLKKEQYYEIINRRVEDEKSGKEIRINKSISLVFESEEE